MPLLTAPRLSLLVVALVAGLSAAAQAPVEPMSPQIDLVPAHGVAHGEAAESADALSHGRLRKLHLVRPDLIPYPLAYDVYC